MKTSGKCTFELFFLGLVGSISCELDEAVHGLWETYGQVRPSRFHGRYEKVPDQILRQAARLVIQHGQPARSEALRQELVEIAQDSEELSPEFSKLLLLMADRLKDLKPERQDFAHLVMAAVCRAFEDDEELCGLLLLQVALILVSWLEADAVDRLREVTSAATLALLSDRNN
jgi:hypothetical protein